MSYKRPQKCLDGSRWSLTNPEWSWGFLMCADLDQMAQNMSRWVQRWSLTVLKCSWCVPMVAEWYLINKFSFIFCWWVSNGIERLWKIDGLFSFYQNLDQDTRFSDRYFCIRFDASVLSAFACGISLKSSRFFCFVHYFLLLLVVLCTFILRN